MAMMVMLLMLMLLTGWMMLIDVGAGGGFWVAGVGVVLAVAWYADGRVRFGRSVRRRAAADRRRERLRARADADTRWGGRV